MATTTSARASGRDLASVLRERIFEPLGMVDTGFTVPSEALSRLTTFYVTVETSHPLPVEHTALVPGQQLTGLGIGHASRLFLGQYGGWGLGLAVPATASSGQPLPCGFGWDGGGTTWRSSPRSGVTGILFTQRQATSPVPPPIVEEFWAGINAATATP
jgi:hypothetical protein